MAVEPVWRRHYEGGVPYSLEYPEYVVPDFLEESARTHPRRAMLVFAGRRLSYAHVNALADRFAGGLLSLGVRPGDRVVIQLPNCPQFPIAFYGALKAGAVAVPVNPLYRGQDLAGILADSGARVLVTLSKFYPAVREVRGDAPVEKVVVTGIKEYLPARLRALFTLFKERKEGHAFPRGEDVLSFQEVLRLGAHVGGARREPWDLAVLQYTGGTTGTPKAAMLTHRNLVANALQAIHWFPTLRRGKEVFAAALPFFHVYGLTGALNAPVAWAATIVLFPQFNAREVLQGVARYQVTFFPGVPAMYVAMNHLKDLARHPLSSVKLFFSGAAPLPLEVKERFERLSGGTVVEGYGLSEASPITHVNPGYGLQKAGSIGIPVPDTEARIVDLETGERELGPGEEGELLVRGPQVMKGYWNRPEETAAALRGGWLHTGDVARVDEDGYFFIVDRKKDMVCVGGFNVYPREIEDLLYRHPAVKEAAVAGVLHPVRGETLVAYVVPRDEVKPSQIVAFCREHLPPYKVPRKVRIVEAIPKTLIGKPLRRAIRELEAAAPESAAPASGEGRAG